MGLVVVCTVGVDHDGAITHLVAQPVHLVVVCTVSVDHDGVCVAVDHVQVQLLHQVPCVQQDLASLSLGGGGGDIYLLTLFQLKPIWGINYLLIL